MGQQLVSSRAEPNTQKSSSSPGNRRRSPEGGWGGGSGGATPGSADVALFWDTTAKGGEERDKKIMRM